MVGEELVPGLPETRRPEECPLSNAEAVAAGLVVSAVRALAVRRYERAEGPAPAVVTRAPEVPAGELDRGAEPGAGWRRCTAVARGRRALPAAAGPRRAGGLSGAGRDAAAGAGGAGAAGVRRASDWAPAGAVDGAVAWRPALRRRWCPWPRATREGRHGRARPGAPAGATPARSLSHHASPIACPRARLWPGRLWGLAGDGLRARDRAQSRARRPTSGRHGRRNTPRWRQRGGLPWTRWQ